MLLFLLDSHAAPHHHHLLHPPTPPSSVSGIDQDLKIAPRNVSWNLDAHLLALDNPLGVGYSYTSSLERMATN